MCCVLNALIWRASWHFELRRRGGLLQGSSKPPLFRMCTAGWFGELGTVVVLESFWRCAHAWRVHRHLASRRRAPLPRVSAMADAADCENHASLPVNRHTARAVPRLTLRLLEKEAC